MANTPLLGPWIRRFLLEPVVGERNLARNTQLSYRDALALLMPFVSAQLPQPIDRLTLEQLSPEVIKAFLAHLEQTRGCSIATRNQRLAAIHAFTHFIAQHRPEYIAWCSSVREIPFKRTAKPQLAYLDKPEMDALLATPDRHTVQGQRDYALLLFLYNTGARASEAAQLKVTDLTLGSSPSVRLMGKGGRVRYCPLWKTTVENLEPLIANDRPEAPVFRNRRGQPLTRCGIHALVQRAVAAACQQVASLRTKTIGPHSIRHTSAVHLLRAGVDINTIRAWLGHVSLDTTHIYAEVDLEMKAKALAHCEVMPASDLKNEAVWHNNPGLMAFLHSI